MNPEGRVPTSPWTDAVDAATLFAIDPIGLSGVALRAAPGSVRDRWLTLIRDSVAAPLRRLPLNVTDDRLIGGLDLAATLHAGRPVAERGILAEADGGILLVAMAERLSAATAARLGAVLDQGEVAIERDGFALRAPARFGVIALDEGIADGERPPGALLDRLAFHVDLSQVSAQNLVEWSGEKEMIAVARAKLADVVVSAAVLEALCGVAFALGIHSLRAGRFALCAARAAAALDGRDEVSDVDAALAARLVLASRATQLPTEPQPEQQDAEPNEDKANSADAEPEHKPNEADAQQTDDFPDEPLQIGRASCRERV